MKDILFGLFLILSGIAIALITKDGTAPLLLVLIGAGGIHITIKQNREEQR